jgi:multidrug transporter EmrE-like cation transporter
MEFLEVPLFDDDLFKLLVRFAINVVFLTIIVKYAVYPNQRERDFAFTAVMMNVTVFFICFALKKLDLGIGMALGLFAIFGVLRYRTDAIRVKEMTYLFIVIGIAVINSLSNKSTSYAELMTVNLLIFGTAMLKERIVGRSATPATNHKTNTVKPPKEEKFSVAYDNLELLGAAQRPALLADLRNRTGINVTRVQIKTIDLGRASATLTIWCDSPAAANQEPV